jgi:hypothetical protein
MHMPVMMSFSEFVAHFKNMQDQINKPDMPLDPQTADIGADRPITLMDIVHIEGVRKSHPREDLLEYFANASALLCERTGLSSEMLVRLPLDDYMVLLGRVVKDLTPKLKKVNAQTAAVDMMRAFEDEGVTH